MAEVDAQVDLQEVGLAVKVLRDVMAEFPASFQEADQLVGRRPGEARQFAFQGYLRAQLGLSKQYYSAGRRHIVVYLDVYRGDCIAVSYSNNVAVYVASD